jgi:flagellar operon protein
MSPVENNPALIPPGNVGGPSRVPGAGRAPGAGGPDRTQPPAKSFADTLRAAAGTTGLHFSKHALERLQRRGIELNPATMQRLGEGVARAAGKGSRDSLVLVDSTAFVVSVRNHTVITAVGTEHMKDNVFTNIDSAVIA